MIEVALIDPIKPMDIVTKELLYNRKVRDIWLETYYRAVVGLSATGHYRPDDVPKTAKEMADKTIEMISPQHKVVFKIN